MTAHTREARLAETFVALADTLVAGYDVVELLQFLVERSASLLDADESGLILLDSEGDVEVVASTTERIALVELLQMRAGEGPCVEVAQTGVAVSIPEVSDAEARWPAFVVAARKLGYGAIHCVPLHLREKTIGSLTLFATMPGALSEHDALAAQALADVATIGILQERAFRELDLTRQQLQHALDSRVVIEQAKGVLAQQRGLDMEDAFHLLRDSARLRNLRLDDLAHRVVARTVEL